MIDANEIYVADSCTNQMAIAGHYRRIGKIKVATLIASGREITPAEAATVGVKLGKEDRGFIFKEYSGIVAVVAGKDQHPWAAIAYHPLPEGQKIPAMTRFPFPVRA